MPKSSLPSPISINIGRASIEIFCDSRRARAPLGTRWATTGGRIHWQKWSGARCRRKPFGQGPHQGILLKRKDCVDHQRVPLDFEDAGRATRIGKVLTTLVKRSATLNQYLDRHQKANCARTSGFGERRPGRNRKGPQAGASHVRNSIIDANSGHDASKRGGPLPFWSG